MAAFNTVPAEEEPLVEKATTKTKTPWRRLACMSAVVSLALGAAAATALRTASGTSMRPAGATMLFGPNPDPDCDNSVHGNAPGYDTDISDKLNEAMNDGGPGFIFRFRFDEQMPCGQTHYDGTEKGLEKICDDKKKYCKNGKCGVAATVLSNWAVTPNPVYCINNEPDGCHTPTVGYYPTDANSVDKRDWKKYYGVPGRGCHGAQQFLQVDDSHWTTYDSTGGGPGGASYYCKCDYDNFDPNSFGDYIVNNLGSGQPSFMGQDYSVCWLEEDDHKTGNLFDNLFAMQNSLYYTSGKWWNGAIGGDDTPSQSGNQAWEYQGWNEVAFDGKIDHREYKDKLHSLVVVLPTDFDNLCDFPHKDVQAVDASLWPYWKDGYGDLPVVIMKSYDNGNGHYKKYAFVQEFTFKTGNRLYNGGDGNVYYDGSVEKP